MQLAEERLQPLVAWPSSLYVGSRRIHSLRQRCRLRRGLQEMAVASPSCPIRITPVSSRYLALHMTPRLELRGLFRSSNLLIDPLQPI
jgi:hypothetical protein